MDTSVPKYRRKTYWSEIRKLSKYKPFNKVKQITKNDIILDNDTDIAEEFKKNL